MNLNHTYKRLRFNHYFYTDLKVQFVIIFDFHNTIHYWKKITMCLVMSNTSIKTFVFIYLPQLAV